MTSLARRIQRIERITPPTIDGLVHKLSAQMIDVKNLSDQQLDDAIAYLEQLPLPRVKRSIGRPIQETGA